MTELSEITAQGTRLVELRKEFSELLLKADALKDQITVLEENVLPAMMMDAGVSELVLNDGTKMAIVTEYYGKIDEVNQTAAFAFLRQTGNEALIKNIFDISFPREDNDAANDLAAFLEERGAGTWSRKKTVHPKTLNSFVKELALKDPNTPLSQEAVDALKVSIVNKVKVKTK